jgi:hypothetical protein
VQGGSTIHVDLATSRSQELDLKAGEVVHVSPRRVRVFLPETAEPDYSI